MHRARVSIGKTSLAVSVVILPNSTDGLAVLLEWPLVTLYDTGYPAARH